MYEPVGHEKLRRHLERFLPPVTLLMGPKGTNAWSLGDYLLRFHGVDAANLIKAVRLDAEVIGNILIAQSLRAMGDRSKGLLINLDRPSHVDYSVHEKNLNKLLRMLETPTGKIVLVSSEHSLPTVESRAVTYRLGLLSDENVSRSLERANQNVSHDEAMKLGGTVYGRKLLEAEGYLKPNVDALLKAVQEKDRALFTVSIHGWKSGQDGHIALRMVRGWIAEALIGKWVRYSPDSAPHLSKDRAKLKSMLLDLDRYVGNAKIIAHAALDKHLGK